MDTTGAVEINAVRTRLEEIRDLTKQLSFANEHSELLESRLTQALDEISGLHTAMETRAIIEQAKGMIMATLKVSADDAFQVLVQRSQNGHTKLVDVARELVRMASEQTATD